jgi:alkaline phosphatase D
MTPSFSLHTLITAWIASACLLTNAQTGPLIGTIKPTEAHFLYRPGSFEKPLRLSVMNAKQQVIASTESTSLAANDHVAKFHITGLSAATAYTYRIEDLSTAPPALLLSSSNGLRFKTASPISARTLVTAAFASCANATSEPVWQRIAALNVDQVVFGGDTPYVDVADLPTIRQKQRAFLETPMMQSLIRSTSSVGTWDDHDFGLNNGNGVNAGDRRVNTRRGFTEYRAHDQYGTGTEGIYHKVQNGPMEIFLLDPRWWSQTMASPVDPQRKTSFGPEQWTWLRQQLENSRAPFKILVMGQIWQDKKNSENDDMFTYLHERDALFDFIKAKKISGVVLVGGDIHVSRHLIHRQRIGYNLHDFITSPAHTSVISSLDVTHPDLEWSSQQPRQFFTLTADTRPTPAVLTGRFYLADGTIQREVVISYDQLVPRSGTGLGRDLRAWWNFDGNGKNASVSGSRFDAVAVNGASFSTQGGVRGGAASFSRASQQYLRIGRQTLDDTPALPERAGRNPLDDNSAAHTVSLWCKPNTLPAHGSTDRHFLLESALGGSTAPGFHLSLGFRSAETDAAKINLELHTVTLQPAAAASTAAPTPLAQGPFSMELDRSLFTNRWAHVTLTFDSTKLTLFVDGTEVAVHTLPVPGPASECAGLIIGGHRDGTGRNFDGLIDEVAIWSRVLTPAEIKQLHNSGSALAIPTEVSAADTDGDTIHDWWECLYGLDSENPADALADTDADGIPSRVEFLSGTHPLVNDAALYQFLREKASPSTAHLPLVFRHPWENSLQLSIRGEYSSNLQQWQNLTLATTPSASLLDSAVELSAPTFAPDTAFFRFCASASSE